MTELCILTKSEAFYHLAASLLEEAGFFVRAISKMPARAVATVVDLDSVALSDEELQRHNATAGCVTVSSDPFRSCDLTRPFRNTELVALCLATFAPEGGLPLGSMAFSSEAKQEEREELLLEEDAFCYCGERIPLTASEYRLFACLFAKRGKVVSEAECLAAVGGERNKLTVYINHLRRKLDHRFGKQMILTVRKQGYQLK